jgi:hypothetical protein
MKLPDGTVTAPGLTFASMLNTGVYRTAAKMGFTWNGVEKFFADVDGLGAVTANFEYLGVSNIAGTFGFVMSYDPTTEGGYLQALNRFDIYGPNDLSIAGFSEEKVEFPVPVELDGALSRYLGSVTVPAGVFNEGDVITIENYDQAGTHTIIQGAGLTMYLKDTTTTGNRTISPNGLATIRFRSSTVCVIGGVT